MTAGVSHRRGEHVRQTVLVAAFEELAANGFDGATVAGVTACFLRGPGVAPHQLQQRVVGDRFEGAFADVSGVPLNYSILVWHSLSIGKSGRAGNGIS